VYAIVGVVLLVLYFLLNVCALWLLCCAALHVLYVMLWHYVYARVVWYGLRVWCCVVCTVGRDVVFIALCVLYFELY